MAAARRMLNWPLRQLFATGRSCLGARPGLTRVHRRSWIVDRRRSSSAGARYAGCGACCAAVSCSVGNWSRRRPPRLRSMLLRGAACLRCNGRPRNRPWQARRWRRNSGADGLCRRKPCVQGTVQGFATKEIRKTGMMMLLRYKVKHDYAELPRAMPRVVRRALGPRALLAAGRNRRRTWYKAVPLFTTTFLQLMPRYR